MYFIPTNLIIATVRSIFCCLVVYYSLCIFSFPWRAHMHYRQDYLYAHKDAVPSLEGAASQLNTLKTELGLEAVFLASDAPLEGKYMYVVLFITMRKVVQVLNPHCLLLFICINYNFYSVVDIIVCTYLSCPLLLQIQQYFAWSCLYIHE